MKTVKIFIKIIAISWITFAIAGIALADQAKLPLARLSYRPDGGVSVTYFLASVCQEDEPEVKCMDRIFSTNMLKDLPYDDIPLDQLPQDREHRDEWRGEKGKGIWVDESLVTKKEKIEEFQEKLDEELDKENPNPSKVLKLQRQMEKVGKIAHSVLTADDLAQFEERQQSFIASVVETVGNFFSDILNGIKQGFLALRNLIIGTPEEPSGVTIYDIKTKQPYCSVVVEGQTVNIPGACSAETIANYLNANSNPGGVILNEGEGSPGDSSSPPAPQNDGQSNQSNQTDQTNQPPSGPPQDQQPADQPSL